MLKKLSLLLPLITLTSLYGMNPHETQKTAQMEQSDSASQKIADANKALIAAVFDNNVAAARQAIGDGAQVTKCRGTIDNRFSYSMLNLAVKLKVDDALLQLLLENEKNVDEKRNAFINCIKINNMQAFNLFLRNKHLFDINAKIHGALTAFNYCCRPALNYCCRPQSTHDIATNYALRLLEEDDIEVNQKGDSEGYYPLHCCLLSAENPHLIHGNVLLRKLLEKGADLMLKDNLKRVPLVFAAREMPQYLPLLIALGADYKRSDKPSLHSSLEAGKIYRELWTLLNTLAIKGSLGLNDLERAFLYYCVGKNVHFAAPNDLDNQWSKLLSYSSIDVNMQPDLSPEVFKSEISATKAITPVSKVQSELHPSCTNKAEHNFESTMPLNLTPIMWAAALNNLSLLECLLSIKQTDVNRQDAQGNTALHWATQNGHPEAVNMLLSHPEVRCIVNLAGQNPRMLAESRLKAWLNHCAMRGVLNEDEIPAPVLSQLKRRKRVLDIFDVLRTKRAYTFLLCKHAKPALWNVNAIFYLPKDVCKHIAFFIRLNDGEYQPIENNSIAQAAAAAHVTSSLATSNEQDYLHQL